MRPKIKKLTLTVFLAAVAIALLAPTAHAYSAADEQAEAAGVYEVENSLDGEVAELMDGISPSDADAPGSLKKLFGAIKKLLPDVLSSALRSGASVMIIAAICSVAQTVLDAAETKWTEGASLAGIAAISLYIFGSSSGFIGLGGETLDRLDSFSKVLLPTMSGLAAAGGEAVSASAKYAAASLFIDILITLAHNLILPLIYAYGAAVVAQAAFGNKSLAAAGSLLKWLAGTMMTLLVLAFIVYLGLTGVVSGVTDAAALRLARTAISSALPVVGGIMSDAAASVLSGTSLLRGTVGIFGILGVTAVCAVPFLKLGAHYLVYKTVSKIAAGFCGSRIEGLLNGLANVFGLVMGLAGSCAVMLYISLISLIKVVTF